MSVTTKERLGAGTHWRLLTANGPVHVWIPDAGAREGTVVYVHGYYDNADQAWSKYNLPAQFQASGRDEMFIVPEAPVGSSAGVNWTDLRALLDTVAHETGVTPPTPVTAIGHSGAYRTILFWLSNSLLEHVTLLDALYAGVANFVTWGNMPGHTLDIIVVRSSADTSANAEVAAKALQGIVKRTTLPLDGAAMGAKALYLVSSLSHFGLVQPATSLIPVLLRRAPGAARLGILGLGLIAIIGYAVVRRFV
jgi:hypothetical protein